MTRWRCQVWTLAELVLGYMNMRRRHTKEVWRVEVVDKWHARDDRSTCDAAHSDQRDQSNLGPPLQLQVPYQEARNNSEGEVGYDTEDTVDVAESSNDCVVDALSFLRSSIPHVRDWVALEETDEEESASSDERDKHGTVDDPGILSACQEYDLPGIAYHVCSFRMLIRRRRNPMENLEHIMEMA